MVRCYYNHLAITPSGVHHPSPSQLSKMNENVTKCLKVSIPPTSFLSVLLQLRSHTASILPSSSENINKASSSAVYSGGILQVTKEEYPFLDPNFAFQLFRVVLSFLPSLLLLRVVE